MSEVDESSVGIPVLNDQALVLKAFGRWPAQALRRLSRRKQELLAYWVWDEKSNSQKAAELGLSSNEFERKIVDVLVDFQVQCDRLSKRRKGWLSASPEKFITMDGVAGTEVGVDVGTRYFEYRIGSQRFQFLRSRRTGRVFIRRRGGWRSKTELDK